MKIIPTLLLVILTFSGYSQMDVVETYGNPNDLATWQAMLDAKGYIRATKGATYTITTLKPGVAQIHFLKALTDYSGFEADGQGCTIILPLDNQCRHLFSVQAHNTYIHDFNVKSTQTTATCPCNNTLNGNNWFGVHSQFITSEISGLKVHNMSFDGVSWGVRFKFHKQVDLAHIEMDNVLTGFSLASSKDVRITDFYVDKRDLGTKLQHGMYATDCSDLIISDGIFKGAADGIPEGTPNYGWSRAINLKITIDPNFPKVKQSGAVISNIKMIGTGGIAVSGHEGAVFNNVSFSHTLGTELVWCVEGATATFNSMAAEFNDDNIAHLFQFGLEPSNITVDGFKFKGPTWIRAGNSKLTLSNGTFTNPLGQLPGHYVVNTNADDADALLRFDNVDFIQTIPHTSLYFGRAGKGRNEFINCNIDASAYPLDYFMNVSTALDAVHVDNNTNISGMNLMRISSHDGYLYWNDNVSKSAFYSERGERIINQTSGNTIEISTRTIEEEYGHELEIFNSTGTGNVIVTTEGSQTINGENEWLVKNNAKFRMNGSNVDVITDGGGIWSAATDNSIDGIAGDGFFSINGEVQNNTELSITASNNEALRINNTLEDQTFSFAHNSDNPWLLMSNASGIETIRLRTNGASFMNGALGLGGIPAADIYANLHVKKDMRIGNLIGESAAIRSTSGTNLTAPDPTGKDLTFYNYHNTETANQWQWNFAGTSVTPASGDHIGLHVYRKFEPASGSASYDFMRISPTIDQTGTGATVGLKIDPTIINAEDFKALETTAGNVVHAGNLASTMTSTTLAASATFLEISSNVVKVTGDSGGNTLTTITGGISGQVLTLIFVDADVTITDNSSNSLHTINLSGAASNFTSSTNGTLTLVFDGTSWRETFRSVN